MQLTRVICFSSFRSFRPFQMYHRDKMHYFLIDFCYFMNALLLFHLHFYPGSAALFHVCFAHCTGPMAFAVVAWRNSCVFHSLDKARSRLPTPETRARAIARISAPQRVTGSTARPRPPPPSSTSTRPSSSTASAGPPPPHPPAPTPPPPPSASAPPSSCRTSSTCSGRRPAPLPPLHP